MTLFFPLMCLCLTEFNGILFFTEIQSQLLFSEFYYIPGENWDFFQDGHILSFHIK